MTSHLRNFAIIAHIDAGKSTLADRFLELTTKKLKLNKQQFLDSNPIEQERGITIKLAPITMFYTFSKSKYTLNLIDTPGHADFSYEVERALSACEGAILLIDATKGIQAQTLSHLRLAQKLGLKVIPAINKIDSPLADLNSAQAQLAKLLPRLPVSLISAKTNQGVSKLLGRVIKEIPPPSSPAQPLQLLIFNSTYDTHLGAIAFIKVVSGSLNNKQVLHSKATNIDILPKELGIFMLGGNSLTSTKITRKQKDSLSPGSVGFIATGLKDIRKLQIGDTLIAKNKNNLTPALAGFHKLQSNVFLNLFPQNRENCSKLSDSLNKLRLSDSALNIEPISSSLLGNGFRVGFLGILHADVSIERLRREFALSVLTSSPTVEYRFLLNDASIVNVTSPEQFPDPSVITSSQEPLAKVNILSPKNYLGNVMKLAQQFRGKFKNLSYIDQIVRLTYHMPLIEVVSSFYESLKSISSGFASLDYKPLGWMDTDLLKLSVFLNHQEIPQLAVITTRLQAQAKARSLAKKLAKIIPRHQFEIPIQVAVGSKILARQTIKAFRKDVTAKLYGGDATRRMKLLQKQKKGKKRMKAFGKVKIPSNAFISIYGPENK